MESLKPQTIKSFVPVKTAMINTHRGVIPASEVDVDDYVPELPMDKLDRVLRFLTIKALKSESDLMRIHKYESEHFMTRFLLPSEIRRLLQIYIKFEKCDKDAVDLIWLTIRNYRPHRDKEGSDGMFPWDGTLSYHHEWDIELYRNRQIIHLPKSKSEGAKSEVKNALADRLGTAEINGETI